MNQKNALAPLIDARSAREALREDIRESVLVAAARLLQQEGGAALTVRRVAEAVNASTKVVYTLFGGKDGLLDALYLHSFDRFGEMLAACRPEASPADRLAAMCSAYRRFALAEPAFYQIMFGDLGKDYCAPATSRERAWLTFRQLAKVIAAASGKVDRTAVADDTRLLWASMHGCVSLELRSLMKDEATSARIFISACTVVAASIGISLEFRD